MREGGEERGTFEEDREGVDEDSDSEEGGQEREEDLSPPSSLPLKHESVQQTVPQNTHDPRSKGRYEP